MDAWGDIDFNWGETGGVARFYGCNSGYKGGNGNQNFILEITKLSNFKNVEIWGQKGSSYPSMFANSRCASAAMKSNDFSQDDKLYMVGSGDDAEMGLTASGAEAVKDMIVSKTKIHVKLTDETLLNEKKEEVHGYTDPVKDNNNVALLNEDGSYVEATIYVTTAEIISKPHDRLNQAPEEEKINAIGTHESVHLRPEQITIDKARQENEIDGVTQEQEPVKLEYQSRKEYWKNNPPKRDVNANYEGFIKK